MVRLDAGLKACRPSPIRKITYHTQAVARCGHEQKRISLNQLILQANKAWHGTKLNQPDWGDYSHSIAFTAEIKKEQMFIHFIFNSYWEPLEFELPPTSTGGKNLWLRWIDTSLDSPNDICDWQTAPPITESTYLTAPRSVVVLWRRSSD